MQVVCGRCATTFRCGPCVDLYAVSHTCGYLSLTNADAPSSSSLPSLFPPLSYLAAVHGEHFLSSSLLFPSFTIYYLDAIPRRVGTRDARIHESSRRQQATPTLSPRSRPSSFDRQYHARPVNEMAREMPEWTNRRDLAIPAYWTITVPLGGQLLFVTRRARSHSCSTHDGTRDARTKHVPIVVTTASSDCFLVTLAVCDDSSIPRPNARCRILFLADSRRTSYHE